MPALKAFSPRTVLVAVSAMCWLIALLYAQHQHPQLVDESVHIPQIQKFLRGQFVIEPTLTMIPGYHALVAGIMKVLALNSSNEMRAISAVFGILASVLFYFIRQSFNDMHSLRQAALLFFLPFLYPYYFLIYTDVLSLALVLGALLAALKQRHLIAAIVITASIAVRQNNVVWSAFIPFFALWPSVSHGRWRQAHAWPHLLRIAAPYSLPVVAFFTYWAWNGTISLSKEVASGHPDLSIHTGNLYFTLFLFLVFFPDEAWRNLKRLFSSVRSSPWLVSLLLLAVIGCSAYLRLQGSYDNYAHANYFVHNGIIQAVKHGLLRHAFGLAIALAAFGIALTRFVVPQAWLLYPFSAFYLASSWLIEGRYSIIPIALWMAFRKTENDNAERWRLIAWIIVSMFFVWGVFSEKFML